MEIKGYWNGYSYKGYIPWLGEYREFVSPEEYLDYIDSNKPENES